MAGRGKRAGAIKTAAASGNTQDCLGLPSFMVIKRSVISLPWLHGVESEAGAVAGVEVG